MEGKGLGGSQKITMIKVEAHKLKNQTAELLRMRTNNLLPSSDLVHKEKKVMQFDGTLDKVFKLVSENHGSFRLVQKPKVRSCPQNKPGCCI